MTDGDSVTINHLCDSANGTFVTLDDYLSLTPNMDPRISLQSKNNTPILSPLNRLYGAKDPRENVRATLLRIIKILSAAPMITIKDDSWRMNKSSSSRNLNIKMRDRFPTTICGATGTSTISWASSGSRKGCQAEWVERG